MRQAQWVKGTLAEFALTKPIQEPVWRERMPADDKDWQFTREERQGLMVLAQLTKEKHG